MQFGAKPWRDKCFCLGFFLNGIWIIQLLVNQTVPPAKCSRSGALFHLFSHLTWRNDVLFTSSFVISWRSHEHLTTGGTLQSHETFKQCGQHLNLMKETCHHTWRWNGPLHWLKKVTLLKKPSKVVQLLRVQTTLVASSLHLSLLDNLTQCRQAGLPLVL